VIGSRKSLVNLGATLNRIFPRRLTIGWRVIEAITIGVDIQYFSISSPTQSIVFPWLCLKHRKYGSVEEQGKVQEVLSILVFTCLQSQLQKKKTKKKRNQKATEPRPVGADQPRASLQPLTPPPPQPLTELPPWPGRELVAACGRGQSPDPARKPGEEEASTPTPKPGEIEARTPAPKPKPRSSTSSSSHGKLRGPWVLFL
jgi:hypothetical protein